MSDDASPIRILVADDHPIVREGVASLVGGQPDMRVVGESSNGRDSRRSSGSADHHADYLCRGRPGAAGNQSWRSRLPTEKFLV